ncbi:hypothetical protein Riv7116_0539 [Rivularia sp. PCC 7116]|uniref:hypothetical protein n=1 Tax=Rivularia sp. PCC 7116 TaxID=373994 RepID=UPI00029F1F95|nr:hypothetical protein [Rivularia sp. PCC 7116]AFY53135.1 hypothetical protein Riv7116_0539 [Rivularia sp. PCC 7116]
MSEKTLETSGKGFLLLLLPLSFLIIFLVSAWRVLLGFFAVLIGFNLWRTYRWQQWCSKVNPVFQKLIGENQGRITPMDLALQGNFNGGKAKRYLDAKASEFGASIADSDDGNKVYYFMTANTLGSILDSSEPEIDFSKQPTATLNKELLETVPVKVEGEPVVELATVEELPEETVEHAEHVNKPLEKQLFLGSLIQSELAKRLGVYSSTVFKRRDDPQFPEWSRNKDPDGIAWTFSPDTKEFFPVEDESKVSS